MIVTCKLLGGLGNNLFQICCVLSYALKYNCDYCISDTIDTPHEPEQKVFHSDKLKYCFSIDKLLEGVPIEDTAIYLEPFFHYNEIPKANYKILILSGYFQSYKYFQDYRPEILTLLNIPKAIGYGRIFLHLRLGDYKELGKFHKIISHEYIGKALQIFYDKGHRDIMVFSDGNYNGEASYYLTAHSRRPNIIDKFNIQYSIGKTPLQDLSLMAACSGGIMSPSSFSYWGAWLGNKDRLITYPREWFGPEYAASHSIVDLCPPGWVAL